jgi:hypothetical protein
MKKRWRFSPFKECSNTQALRIWKNGMHEGFKLPMSNFCNLTFRSLHALVSSCYFCKFSIALSLYDSSRSFSSTSLGHKLWCFTSVAVHKLRCFTSSGSTASALYISWNGVKFVALHTIVLRLYTTFDITSAHLPFFSLSSIFLIASNIKALALSTTPLD